MIVLTDNEFDYVDLIDSTCHLPQLSGDTLGIYLENVTLLENEAFGEYSGKTLDYAAFIFTGISNLNARIKDTKIKRKFSDRKGENLYLFGSELEDGSTIELEIEGAELFLAPNSQKKIVRSTRTSRKIPKSKMGGRNPAGVYVWYNKDNGSYIVNDKSQFVVKEQDVVYGKNAVQIALKLLEKDTSKSTSKTFVEILKK